MSLFSTMGSSILPLGLNYYNEIILVGANLTWGFISCSNAQEIANGPFCDRERFQETIH